MSRFIAILLALSALLASREPEAAATAPSPAGPPVLLVFGDSLSAGYGLGAGQGWVQLLALRIKSSGYEFRVVNASSSGETTAGGVARLPRALKLHQPRLVILELGGNDGLRGLPVSATRQNLDSMLQLARAQGSKVLLLGMRMPPNYGARYVADFQRIFPELARKHRAALVPFFLDGVATDAALMQNDGLHPNADGQPRLLGNVWPVLEPLLKP